MLIFNCLHRYARPFRSITGGLPNYNLFARVTAPEDLLELLDPADAPLAEVDLEVPGEFLINHVLQNLHKPLELGVLSPGARCGVFYRYASDFAHT